MKIVATDHTLSVSEIQELAGATAVIFHAELAAAWSGDVRQIDLDLSQTTFVDCGGLGALVALRKKAANGHGSATIRLLNPPKPLQHMVDVMQMGSVFPMEMIKAV